MISLSPLTILRCARGCQIAAHARALEAQMDLLKTCHLHAMIGWDTSYDSYVSHVSEPCGRCIVPGARSSENGSPSLGQDEEESEDS